MTTRALARALGAAVLALAVGGCSSGSIETYPDAPAVVQSALTAARDTGASDEQVAILELAAHEGRDVTYQEIRSGIDIKISCLTDSGITVRNVTEHKIGPTTEVSFEYLIGALGEAQADAIVEECATKHSAFLEMAYYSQVAVAEWQDETIRSFGSAMRECLVQRGVEIPADPTVDEIIQGNLDAPDDANGDSCMIVTGLNLELTGTR